MKTKIILLFFPVLLVMSCNGGINEIIEKDDIIGQWKLTGVRTMYNSDYQNVIIEDYSNSNIIYDFRVNNKLTVTGYIADDLSEGEHFYEYTKMIFDPLSLPGPNLRIDNNELVFCEIKDNEMTVGIDDHITNVDENGRVVRKWKTFIKLN
ncbi:MAG: hypothetical protein LBS16_06570 [Prevotellaceae bacterium]|jgi:hypothetical protein|nr:hypothetical protein [Prevotellaceae bacterium]